MYVFDKTIAKSKSLFALAVERVALQIDDSVTSELWQSIELINIVKPDRIGRTYVRTIESLGRASYSKNVHPLLLKQHYESVSIYSIPHTSVERSKREACQHLQKLTYSRKYCHCVEKDDLACLKYIQDFSYKL